MSTVPEQYQPGDARPRSLGVNVTTEAARYRPRCTGIEFIQQNRVLHKPRNTPVAVEKSSILIRCWTRRLITFLRENAPLVPRFRHKPKYSALLRHAAGTAAMNTRDLATSE